MKKVLSSILVVSVLLGCVGVFGVSANEYKYKDAVFEKLQISENYPADVYKFSYSEIFEYFADEDNTQSDYVLIELYSNMALDATFTDFFGNYIISTGSSALPYHGLYYVYIPKDGEVYTLREAYDNCVEGIEQALPKCSKLHLMGDTDFDGIVTVKDVSLVQKALAGLCELNDTLDGHGPCGISDFDRDGERTIKDVSAIQKHIAGLDINAPDAEE